jgi:hypothetical protein
MSKMGKINEDTFYHRAVSQLMEQQLAVKFVRLRT